MKNALYIQIFNDYRNLIKTGQLIPGDEIPSEAMIRDKYNCSRDTVRKATSLLEQKGYIKKSRGVPSIVIEKKQYSFPASTIDSFKELNKRDDLQAKTSCISLKSIPKNRFNFLKKFSSNTVIEVKRVREIQGKRIILDIDYLDTNFVPNITKEIAENSLYEYFENDLGLEIGYADKLVTVESVEDELIELLDVKEDDLLVLVESETYLKSGQLFQHTLSYHKYDKFRFRTYASRQ